MRKKILTLCISLFFVFAFTACEGAQNTDQDASIKALEKELEETKKELEKLKDLQSNQETIPETVEQETWEDDTIIAFTDAKMAADIKKMTGITERDITYGDVKNIIELDVSYNDIEALKYFTSLVKLTADTGESINLNAIGNLTNLQSLEIKGYSNLADISAIGNLSSLQELQIGKSRVIGGGYINLTDISAIGNLSNLQYICIEECDNLPDINNLEELTAFYNNYE